MAKIIGIGGSLREGSTTLLLVNEVLNSAKECGAETELINLRNYTLPLFEAHLSYKDHSALDELLSKIDNADGIVLGSPEYHGTISGALKNLLDFQYRHISGKAIGLIASTSGGPGIGCFDTMRKIVQSCHGWAIPYNVAGCYRDFDESGTLNNPKLADRIQRLGRDLTIYGPLLKKQFDEDKEIPPHLQQGFASW